MADAGPGRGEIADPQGPADRVGARRGARPLPNGILAVPYWVMTILLLGLVLLVALTALVFIPSGQRPTLEPPSPGGSAATAATPS